MIMMFFCVSALEAQRAGTRAAAKKIKIKIKKSKTKQNKTKLEAKTLTFILEACYADAKRGKLTG